MSSGQPQPSQQGEPIRLTPEQLERFRQQTAEEIEQLSDLLRQLRVANNKFVDSKHSVELMGKDKEGKLKQTESVLVDIGSHYFVRKSIPDAVAFFDRKIAFVHDQIASMDKVIQGKTQQLQQLNQLAQKPIEQ